MKRTPLQRKRPLLAKTPLKAHKPMKRVREKPRKKARPKRKEWVKVFDDGRQVLNLETALGRREYKRRTLEMWERQDGLCPMCRLFIPIREVTFDHENGRGAGKRDDRVWIDNKPYNHALHYLCNNQKSSRRIEMPYYGCEIKTETI